MKRKLILLALLTSVNLAYAQIFDGGGNHGQAGECTSYSINISTGIDNAGNVLPIGNTDPNWNAPFGMNVVTAPLYAYSQYWSTLPGSQWLGKIISAAATRTYTRAVNIPAGGVGTITFQALADNNVRIYLDGSLIAQSPNLTSGPLSPLTDYGYDITQVVNYTGKICPGNHTLTADVFNDFIVGENSDDFYNPSGFNLSGSVNYTVVNTGIDISTGLGTNYVLLPSGATDPNWTCSVPGYTKVQTVFPPWDNLTGSEWIGDLSDGNAAGDYLYDRSFNIAASEGCLVFDALADNSVQFFIDGGTTPVAQTSGTSSLGFTLPYRVTYSGGVSAGAHTLHAKVHNNEYQVGLNLHGSILYCAPDYGSDGRCATDPTFTALSGSSNTANFYSSTNPVNYPSGSVVVTHYWDFGDGNNSGATNPVHTYPTPGIYAVTHTITKTVYIVYPDHIGSMHCESTQTCLVTIGKEGVLSISCDVPQGKAASTADKLALPGNITVFPNPAYEELHVSGNIQGCDLQIFSLDGRKLTDQKGFRGKNIDISGLAAGTYICRIIRDGTITNIKFSKAE